MLGAGSVFGNSRQLDLLDAGAESVFGNSRQLDFLDAGDSALGRMRAQIPG
jgi:hypothetical protein